MLDLFHLDNKNLRNIKGRYWVAVGYTDSMSINWLDYLNSICIPIAISPYHDKDINADGTYKKPHFHILFCYDNPTTALTLKNHLENIGINHFQKVDNVRGMYRYLNHRDNPEKYQYNEEDITHLNGFNPTDYISISSGQLMAYKTLIFAIIKDKHILEYCDLIDYINDVDNPDLTAVVSSNTYLFNTYISSYRNKIKSYEKMINK